MEYLLITTFAFILLMAIVVVAYSQSASFTGAVTTAQIQKVGNTILDGVNSVYYSGPPTKKTITVFFPENVKDVVVLEDTIIFTVNGEQGEYEYVVYAATNMSGVIRPFKGKHTISMTARSLDVAITDR
jgi:hypothetical protein